MLLDDQETIECEGFTATIKRTRRKGSVGFRVTAGQLVVLAPMKMPRAQLKTILQSHSVLLLDKLASYANSSSLTKSEPAPVRRYLSGESVRFLDRNLVLEVKKGRFNCVQTDSDKLVVTVPKANPVWVKNAVVRWYKAQAQAHFADRVFELAQRVGATPSQIEIKTYRARWGSCTSAGKVQFNWKLMMAPEFVVDSVVVHELCHLLHMHHSAEFWAQVQRAMPNYKTAKLWLKERGQSLSLD